MLDSEPVDLLPFGIEKPDAAILACNPGFPGSGLLGIVIGCCRLPGHGWDFPGDLLCKKDAGKHSGNQ